MATIVFEWVDEDLNMKLLRNEQKIGYTDTISIGIKQNPHDTSTHLNDEFLHLGIVPQRIVLIVAYDVQIEESTLHISGINQILNFNMTRRIDKYYLISENLDNYRKEVRERALNNPLL